MIDAFEEYRYIILHVADVCHDFISRCMKVEILFQYHLVLKLSTVEPPKRGHFGNGTFVLSSEVVLFLEVV